MLLDIDSIVIIETTNKEFFENKFISNSISDKLEESSNTRNIVDLSPSTKRKYLDLSSEPQKSQRPRKQKHLYSYFISSQAIVFLVEGNREK